MVYIWFVILSTMLFTAPKPKEKTERNEKLDKTVQQIFDNLTQDR